LSPPATGSFADADRDSTSNHGGRRDHVVAQCGRASHPLKPPGPETFPPAAAAGLLAPPNHLVFIAEVDSLPLGYAYAEVIHRPENSSHYANDMVYLHHISVRPAHRKRGLGRALMDAVRSAASERGITLVALDVWAFNEEARAFFRRQGFTSYNERLWNR
jgi:ribosomal protein S18 acetylase RimI-like enzyme